MVQVIVTTWTTVILNLSILNTGIGQREVLTAPAARLCHHSLGCEAGEAWASMDLNNNSRRRLRRKWMALPREKERFRLGNPYDLSKICSIDLWNAFRDKGRIVGFPE